MARTYVNLPVVYVDFLKPQRMKVDVVASAIDGGRNMLGQTISVGASGGGYVTATYESCWVHEREEHEYANWLGAYLNGSTRFINVPLKTDWMGPFPVLDRWPAPFIPNIPHSDGATFSDGAGYSQPTVWGRVLEDAVVGAGQIKIRVFGAARPIRWSDWFSLSHPTKGNRAYRSWQQTEIGSGSEAEPGSGVATAYRDYLLAIGPALREAATAGMRVEFARPMFAAKLPPGVTVPWEVESFWIARPTLQFTEAF